MTKTPTIMQYLVTLVANSKLNAANATKDPATIAKAEKQYKNLSEDEVTFTKPFNSILTGGKWQTTMTSVKRGWQIPKLTYNTGTLKALTSAVVQAIANKASLDLATVAGVYHIEETGNIHLLVEKDSNIFDALKLTGFEFPVDAFKTVMFNVRDTDIKADGYVDIDHSVVAGRFMLSYIQRKDVAPAPQSFGAQTLTVTEGKEEAPQITEGVENIPQTLKVASSYDSTAALTTTPPVEEEEVTEENTAPEEKPVEETKPVTTQTSGKNGKK